MYTSAGFGLGIALVCSLAAPATEAASVPRCSLAVIHVNLIPMDSDRVLPDRTLRVGNGKILSITPADARPVSCRRVIDGAGRYLVPGLNDMHMHLETVAFAEAFGLKPEPIDYPSVLALYIANGVTGLRVMSGAPDILAFRDRQRGTVSPYPRLVVASPMLSGAPPVLPEPVTKILRSPEEAREAVHRYSIQGYDFIKVRDNLPAPVLRAAIEEAARDGMYVDGHISQRQGLSVFEVLGSGQHAFAHLDDLALQMKDKVHDPERFIAFFKKCGCFIETTIGIERNTLAQLDDYATMIARPGMKFMNPLIVNAFWLKPNNPYLKERPPRDFLTDLFADSKMLLKKFTDAGIHVVAGTDALNPMILPGVSLHDEFDNMIEAGLSPYEALKTATANPAAYVPGFGDAGVLAKGRAANAVLVKNNPLLDIRALRDPDAVMIGGHWRDREQIHSMLHAVAPAADFRERAAGVPWRED
jgi:imidazolonepropionase-like amidohydrolase